MAGPLASSFLRALPISLTILRLVLGPVMIALAAWAPRPQPWLLMALWAAILSDIFDGIIARRVGVATPLLRRLDSQCDLVFWLCALGAVAVLHWPILRAGWPIILPIILMEAGIYGLSYLRFGREACTHAYSAKAFGLALLYAFTAILGFGEGWWSLRILLIVYSISWVDIVLILLILPEWTNDVPSAYHAWLVRRGVPFRRHAMFHG